MTNTIAIILLMTNTAAFLALMIGCRGRPIWGLRHPPDITIRQVWSAFFQDPLGVTMTLLAVNMVFTMLLLYLLALPLRLGYSNQFSGIYNLTK